MKITNKQVYISAVSDVSSDYIENELRKQNINFLRWAIVDVKDGMYSVNVSCCED